MKNFLFNILLILPITLSAQHALIKIDIDRAIGDIDPRIYGVFMEPIHFNGSRMGLSDTIEFNTLYGNLYDPSSPLANEEGFRQDYIDVMRELKITNMRWPGGNFVMGYNWKDGIGPKEQRPTRINLAWGGVDNNHVGTDEWIALNRAIDSENIICVNLGLATIQDAAEWVEYCNYIKGTYYSDFRIENGNKEPFNVKIWDLGNEVDGEPWELGYKNADDYIKIGKEAAKAMKAVDSTIQLVASGSSYYESSGRWVDWNRKVLEGLGDKIDYLSIHRYWERSDDYYSYMGQSAMDFEEKITIPSAAIETARAKMGFENPIYIAFDEWGVFGRDFRSVLPIAQCLNSFVRHADVVKITNFTLMTSLIQTDPEKGSFKTPLFHTFKMFSNNCLGSALDIYVECDTFNTEKYLGIPYLDVTAVYSKESNTIFINVVNRHKDKAITTDILNASGELTSKAEVTSINRSDLKEPFTYEKALDYEPIKKEINSHSNELTYSFPPHSITQIKIGIK
ncbi:alpha-L-arabinofuranosidase C-terminal domain-containing protein [Flexithrix dorotheae]|uniref:alpha-L-arabinofuranosidase C-terminal domain-containing protein n=1 Tax=Flexithrix dorotheae TaxID=70993 RepID=UPI0006943B17|nr:alpha-L-arabinofuranosidase C-terminal domain-containing protein [Flexithrix dorotheae]